MLSDPIDYPVTAGERLAISVYFPEKTAPPAHAQMVDIVAGDATGSLDLVRSEEHTSELQSLMRISYAVFCLKKKTKEDPQQDMIEQSTTSSQTRTYTHTHTARN